MQERLLTNKLLKNFNTIKDFYFTEGNVCFDCLVNMISGIKIIGEVKVRSFEINKYDDYIIEVAKLIRLMKKREQNEYDKICYINFFEHPKKTLKDFIVFNLSERIKEWKNKKPEVKKMWMNETTYLSKTKKVEKEVIMLKYDEKIDCKGTININ